MELKNGERKNEKVKENEKSTWKRTKGIKRRIK
jgi:hypothetical protein